MRAYYLNDLPAITYFSPMRFHWYAFLIMALATISCNEKPQDPVTSVAIETAVEFELIQVEPVQRNHVRGLFMVDDKTVWASGARGTFLKCVDGTNWVSDTIAGYTHLDFRDVHAFDDSVALVMAAGEEGRILRTKDGGENWEEVYTNLSDGIFLDGIDFNGDLGYCYGDPINGKMTLVRTEDRGKTWFEVDPETIPSAMPNEAGFAASGTGIIVDDGSVYLATGGDISARLLSQVGNEWTAINTPMRSAEGCGIFSMAHIPPSTIVAVGGCYLDSTSADGNCAISHNMGQTWELISENRPNGYRSCVAYSDASEIIVACGRTGVDYSVDRGKTWKPISTEGYYTCVLGDSVGWLMGKHGKVAELNW